MWDIYVADDGRGKRKGVCVQCKRGNEEKEQGLDLMVDVNGVRGTGRCIVTS